MARSKHITNPKDVPTGVPWALDTDQPRYQAFLEATGADPNVSANQEYIAWMNDRRVEFIADQGIVSTHEFYRRIMTPEGSAGYTEWLRVCAAKAKIKKETLPRGRQKGVDERD